MQYMDCFSNHNKNNKNKTTTCTELKKPPPLREGPNESEIDIIKGVMHGFDNFIWDIVQQIMTVMKKRDFFTCPKSHYKTPPLRNLCLKFFLRKKAKLLRPPLWNINMTQFKAKVPEWRFFVGIRPSFSDSLLTVIWYDRTSHAGTFYYDKCYSCCSTIINENAWALTRPPATCPLCQYSCLKVIKRMSRCHAMMSCCDVMTSRCDVTLRHISWHNNSSLQSRQSHNKKSENHFFFQNGEELNFDKINWTLNFDLWPWPPNSSEILSKAMSTPNFSSLAQMVQPWECWQTNTQTDGTDFIPSTADVGGKYG